ncbi:outer membrane beta-barrel protein [Hydrogenimonas sp.]
MLQKKFAAMLLAGTIATGAMAAEGTYKPFIGAELGGGKAEFEWLGDSEKTDWETVWGLKGGFYDENTRVYASFHYVDADSDSTKQRWYDLTANLEAMTTPYRVTDDLATSFFAGAHLGAIKIKVEDNSVNFDDEETDFCYGIQAGVNFIFNPHVNVEIGGRVSWSNLEFGLYELNYYYNVYGGINYYF